MFSVTFSATPQKDDRYFRDHASVPKLWIRRDVEFLQLPVGGAQRLKVLQGGGVELRDPQAALQLGILNLHGNKRISSAFVRGTKCDTTQLDPSVVVATPAPVAIDVTVDQDPKEEGEIINVISLIIIYPATSRRSTAAISPA